MRRYNVKFEYTGSWFRIVVEIFHRELPFSKLRAPSRRNGEEFRRRMLRKVIHKIGETTV